MYVSDFYGQVTDNYYSIETKCQETLKNSVELLEEETW
jgi:hypothetical protein